MKVRLLPCRAFRRALLRRRQHHATCRRQSVPGERPLRVIRIRTWKFHRPRATTRSVKSTVLVLCKESRSMAAQTDKLSAVHVDSHSTMDGCLGFGACSSATLAWWWSCSMLAQRLEGPRGHMHGSIQFLHPGLGLVEWWSAWKLSLVCFRRLPHSPQVERQSRHSASAAAILHHEKKQKDADFRDLTSMPGTNLHLSFPDARRWGC
jgi:hypothetical protein